MLPHQRDFADVIKLRILRLEDYLRLSGQSQCHYKERDKKVKGDAVPEGEVRTMQEGAMWREM